MVKSLIYVTRIWRIIHISRKYFVNTFVVGPIRNFGPMCLKETGLELAVLLDRRNFPPTFFCRLRKFGSRCITLVFGFCKFCKYFEKLLTCFPCCSRNWWCPCLLRKRSAKSWACGSKQWTKILGAFVFFLTFYQTFSRRAYGKAKNLLKKFAENLRRQNCFFCRNLSKFGNKRTLLLKFDAHLLVTRCSIGLLSSFSTHSWLKRPFRKFSAAELFWLQEKWRRNFWENCFFSGRKWYIFSTFQGPSWLNNMILMLYFRINSNFCSIW